MTNLESFPWFAFHVENDENRKNDQFRMHKGTDRVKNIHFDQIFAAFLQFSVTFYKKEKKIAKMSTRQRWWWQTWIPMVCISRRNQSFLMQICVSNCSVIFHSWNKPSSLRAKGPRGLEIANRQLSIYHLQPLDNLCKKLDILALPCKKSESATINTQWGLNQFKIRWKLWMLFFA